MRMRPFEEGAFGESGPTRGGEGKGNFRKMLAIFPLRRCLWRGALKEAHFVRRPHEKTRVVVLSLAHFNPRWRSSRHSRRKGVSIGKGGYVRKGVVVFKEPLF